MTGIADRGGGRGTQGQRLDEVAARDPAAIAGGQQEGVGSNGWSVGFTAGVLGRGEYRKAT